VGHVPSLLDRLKGVRDRLVADRGFREWASRFPLTRPLARRRARALFDLAAGFVYAQVLVACVRLRLFDMLHEKGPLPLADLSPRLGLDPEGAARLLVAAEALGLVERRGGDRWALATLGAAVIGNDGLTAMVEHHALLYADLADPVALLRRGPNPDTALARYWAYARAEQPGSLRAEAVSDYSALMAASQGFIAEEVLAAYPALGRHRCLLDLGGGDGRFLAAAAAKHPALRLVLFDLPPVAARAEARFASAGLAGRARAVGGSFLDAESLPRGEADIVSLVRVVHDHDDDNALTILRAARAALPPGGTLLLAEPMAGTPGAEPAGAAYFGFYLLAMGSGRPRRAEELRAMLRQAGFERVRELPTRTPLLVRVLCARAAGTVSFA
jgi:demethylspheroidene O-methyltransferase